MCLSLSTVVTSTSTLYFPISENSGPLITILPDGSVQ